MPFISSVNINTEKTNPFPYSVPAIKYARNLQFNSSITFLVGDNGTGKSSLLEAIALKLSIPLIDGFISVARGFEAANELQKYLEIVCNVNYPGGFFFRAEDFSHFINSVERSNTKLEMQMNDLKGEVTESVIKQMRDSANTQLREMRKNYGSDMVAFSHGEAYLEIMHQRVKNKGIFLLDEPEAALSPARQLSLIYFIQNHIKKYKSQFIIATHAPMLMAFPGAIIYEITDEGMEQVSFEETEHYTITKNFLNNPELYLRNLE